MDNKGMPLILEEQARETALRENYGTIRKLECTLRGDLALLREKFRALHKKTRLDGWEQWIFDNFYALEGHAKQTLLDLRGFRKNGAAFFWLYKIMEEFFSKGETLLSQENVRAVLQGANAVRELGERQFDFVFPALQCALLHAGASACKDGGETGREPLISYAVVGLATLSELDFDLLTRSVSAVERVLEKDPSGVYPRMAEQSKKHYRHVTARLARKTGTAESGVAQEVLTCAEDAKEERTRHVGFYLLNHDPQTIRAHRRGILAIAGSWLLPIAVCGFLWGASPFAGLLAYLPLVELTRSILCPFAVRGIPAAHIPRMKLSKDAPKTVVAVSTLLPCAAKAEHLRERLEQLYFSNPEKNLSFCVLADFKEDCRPYNPQDEHDVTAARDVVKRLNEQYQNQFMLFIRRRSFCETQNTYCGWERKRGAIIEFIRFLKGEKTSVSCFCGDRSALSGFRYLIALDADTNLSFESAELMISAAVHPLNRPVIGKDGIVTAGYGILVPRVETDLDSAKATDFTRIMAGAGGISTYEQECCDFYQDLFGEAIFSGKGLIDIDVFHTVVGRCFPENAVLSHDSLEGAYLRTGLLSDVEMTDGMPTNALSWFTRLHRWIRGDWQNLPFLSRRIRSGTIKRENPISLLSRYKLADNLRRSITPVAALACVIAAAFTGKMISLILCAVAFFSTVAAPLSGALRALLSGGSFAMTRRYFARTLPRVFELLGQALFAVVMTAQQAVVTLDAVMRTLWRRFISHKNLLQWTTAAQGETRNVSFFAVLRRSWVSEWMGLLLLIFAPREMLTVKLYGALFLLYAPLAAATARPTPEPKIHPDRVQRERLLSWCAQMFRFYEDYADEKNHWLPPDNVQFSPVEAVARRTSPTNIGMLLLSILAARDFHFIDSAGLHLRLSRVLDTVETLKTYRGNLYNWYATDDLRVLPEPFVSTVDSGNYLCSLVALKEGVAEYAAQEPALKPVIARVEKLLAKTDFSIFYNKRRRLLTIGLDADGKQVGSHYDFLMSEARTASYYAIATRQARHRHWRALNRTMSRCGAYAGPVSWTGTMFEYFMPHLLLPVYEGSLLSEALQYALYAQKRRARRAGVPWGISESGYYAFDEQLNYQYKAHGVQSLGVKRGLDRECVVAPYASFLTLPFDLDGSMKNLFRLEAMGMTGRYGFFESADFTRGNTDDGGFSVVRSCMAHHVGMSMVACANVMLEGVMQKRFMRDRAMRSAREFLQEKISKDTVVYDQMKPEENLRRESAPLNLTITRENPNPCAPACSLLAGRELTHLFSDTGVSWLRFANQDISRRSTDPLLHAQGIFALAKLCGETISATAAPFWQEDVIRRCDFLSDAVTYHAKRGEVGLTMRFTLDANRPVERCTLTLHNKTGNKAIAQVLFYFEPVLEQNSEYAAHPAFSKLFLLGARDAATDTVTFLRRRRDGSDGLYLSAGFAGRENYESCLQREQMTPCPAGLENLLRFDSNLFDGKTATPDGCCALRLTVSVPAHGENSVTLLLSAAASLEESVGNLVAARGEDASPARSLLMNDTIAGRLGERLLPELFLSGVPCKNGRELAKNTRGQDALWSLGISGDLPIVLFDWDKNPDPARLSAYVKLWELLRLRRWDFDLCVLGAPEISLPEGIKMILSSTDPSAITALRAAACHIAGDPEPEQIKPWIPARFLHPLPAEIPKTTDRFDVVGGAFAAGRFYVERITPLPFSHILANPSFGCLLGDTSLGNSWWMNARECKLTPWLNDIATGNDGERLLLKYGNEQYDLINGSRASFSPADARYEGKAGAFGTSVRVTVSESESIKTVELELDNETDEEAEILCAYVMEPVLGVSRANAKFIKFDRRDDCLLLHNPWNTEVPCHLAIHVPEETPGYTADRAAFYAGDWSAHTLLPNNDPIAGVIISKRLPPRRRKKIKFILAAAAEPETARTLALRSPAPAAKSARRSIEITTPSTPLDRFINLFAPHQIIAGRLNGRCAFYQCSGAFGFRDQLQDAGACLPLDPAIAKEQILRCCAVQFTEGDVLHWWHALPNATRGVRTRFSDDLLWLPLTVCDYVETTGEMAFLDTEVAFCTGESLTPEQQERYQQISPSAEKASIFEHCIRAIECGWNTGDKGIPKIGCGDWNDGFSNVGTGGNGQSVWLGLFLAIVCERFAPLCDARDDRFRGDLLRANAALLRRNIDKNCWDGQWYLRAFYDDGTPLGGKECEECQIDLLSQSFAVFAGMPDSVRVKSALDAAISHLVDWEGRIVKLFEPPFDHSTRNPGYIKAYPTGVRENGGQYTHAAVWLALALLRVGRADEGWKLLDLLNPVSRCVDAACARAFKTEPYYMPADIYTHADAYGHGGWSIYTGAGAWYYRAVIGTLLGIQFRGGQLKLSPHIPNSWNHFAVTIRDGDATLAIECSRTGEPSLTVDGISAQSVLLDGKNHTILLTI